MEKKLECENLSGHVRVSRFSIIQGEGPGLDLVPGWKSFISRLGQEEESETWNVLEDLERPAKLPPPPAWPSKFWIIRQKK